MVLVFIVTSNVEYYEGAHHEQCVSVDCVDHHISDYQSQLEDHNSKHNSKNSSEASDCDSCKNHLHLCCHHTIAHIKNENSIFFAEADNLKKFFQKKCTLKPSPFLDGPFRPPLV